METYTITFFGILTGLVYYLQMKDSIKEPFKNCSFVANKMTDILAFLAGGILVYYGLFVYNNPILSLLGIAIITEHILQLTYKF